MAVLGIIVGLPTGSALVAAPSHGDKTTAPSASSLIAIVFGTVLAVAAITAIPGRIGHADQSPRSFKQSSPDPRVDEDAEQHCVGTGFGDRFGVSQGGSRGFGEVVRSGEELGVLRGKRARKRCFGKEGVDSSSPSEGFTKGQQANGPFCCLSGVRPSLERPSTCPQGLSPTSREPGGLGLSKGIRLHRAPPCRGGAPPTRFR